MLSPPLSLSSLSLPSVSPSLSPAADDPYLFPGVGVDGTAAHIAGERRLQTLHDATVVLFPDLSHRSVGVSYDPDSGVGTRHLTGRRGEGEATWW